MLCRIRLLAPVFLFALISLVLTAACGDGLEEESTEPAGQQAAASGGSGPQGGSAVTAGQTVPSGTSGTEPQSSGSPGQVVTSSGNAPSLNDACDAFAGAGGFGGFGDLSGGFANIISGAQGGPSIQTQFSQSPTSDESAAIADFFVSALNDAFGGGVSAECYWELSASQAGESGLALWISLQLPSVPSAEQIQATQDSLAAKGATVGGFFASPVGGEVSATILVSDLPLDQGGDSGGMLMFMEQFAIIIAGQGTDFGTGQSPQALPPSVAPPPPLSFPQVSVDAEGITGWFQGKLEDALDVSLEVEASFQSQSSLLVTFRIPEGSSLPSDIASRFEDIAESANASIAATISAAGVVVVSFENLEVEGTRASGAMALDGNQNTITVTLQQF